MEDEPPTTACHNVIRHMIGVYADETRRLLRLLGWGDQPIGRYDSDTSEIAGEVGMNGFDVDEIAGMVMKVLQERRS